MARIVIDPGHYEAYNPGVCAGYFEGNRMMELANLLANSLTEMGAEVTLTRTSDAQNPTLAQRGGKVPGADLFISLHSDASDDTNARGVTVYNSVQRPGSEPFAAEVGRAAAGAMGNQFRGVVARPSGTNPNLDYLGVLRAASAAGVRNAFLVEHGFHTNPQDCAVLFNDEKLAEIAEAEANVIARHFGLEQPEVRPTPPAIEPNLYYVVQRGDSLFLIGKKFGVPWQDIATVNGIHPPYLLMPGQRLLIPPAR